MLVLSFVDCRIKETATVDYETSQWTLVTIVICVNDSAFLKNDTICNFTSCKDWESQCFNGGLLNAAFSPSVHKFRLTKSVFCTIIEAVSRHHDPSKNFGTHARFHVASTCSAHELWRNDVSLIVSTIQLTYFHLLGGLPDTGDEISKKTGQSTAFFSIVPFCISFQASENDAGNDLRSLNQYDQVRSQNKYNKRSLIRVSAWHSISKTSKSEKLQDGHCLSCRTMSSPAKVWFSVSKQKSCNGEVKKNQPTTSESKELRHTTAQVFLTIQTRFIW
jgi:hypothetical protein